MSAVAASGLGVSPNPWGENLVGGVSRLVLISSSWCSCQVGPGFHRGCGDASVPHGAGTRSQTTSALPGFNRHRGSVLGEFLVLPRRLYLFVSALGHQNGHAAAMDSHSPLQLAPVRL